MPFQRKQGWERRDCQKGAMGLIKIYISFSLCLLAISKADFNLQVVFTYKASVPLLVKIKSTCKGQVKKLSNGMRVWHILVHPW